MLGIRSVCLPSWVPWCAQLIIVPLWLWITYEALIAESSQARLSTFDWALATFTLFVISLFLFLAGYRKLAASVAAENSEPTSR